MIIKKCPRCKSNDTKFEIGGVFSCNKCSRYWKAKGLEKYTVEELMDLQKV